MRPLIASKKARMKRNGLDAMDGCLHSEISILEESRVQSILASMAKYKSRNICDGRVRYTLLRMSACVQSRLWISTHASECYTRSRLSLASRIACRYVMRDVCDSCGCGVANRRDPTWGRGYATMY
jgi:hypothetical protein